MTLFSQLLAACGLSQTEAAAFLGVRIDSLKSWSSGRREAPAGVWGALWDLAEKQQKAAENGFDAWDEVGQPDQLEFGLASDDAEAKSLGWPCVGAHLAVVRRLFELIPPDAATIRVVPRGSTPATAAAADQREG